MINLKDKKVVVTGGGGFLGSHVAAKLRQRGVIDIFMPSHRDYDLRNRDECIKVVAGADIVIHLAAQVGGIGFMKEKAGEVFYNNLIMGLEMMEAARQAEVKKFVVTGTVCSYPKIVNLPFKEKDLWNGYPEETTAPYGWAKKMFIVQAKAYKDQYGFNAINLIPVNLYGPGDNFGRVSAHVIPALIRKIVQAKDERKEFVEVWGSGHATREFLYVEDAAEGIVLATENYDEVDPVNLGTGVETSIKEVTELIMDLVGYKGIIKWNSEKPDGQPRRQLNVSKAEKLFGFKAQTDLKTGLKNAIDWFEKHRNK